MVDKYYNFYDDFLKLCRYFASIYPYYARTSLEPNNNFSNGVDRGVYFAFRKYPISKIFTTDFAPTKATTNHIANGSMINLHKDFGAWYLASARRILIKHYSVLACIVYSQTGESLEWIHFLQIEMYFMINNALTGRFFILITQTLICFSHLLHYQS